MPKRARAGRTWSLRVLLVKRGCHHGARHDLPGLGLPFCSREESIQEVSRETGVGRDVRNRRHSVEFRRPAPDFRRNGLVLAEVLTSRHKAASHLKAAREKASVRLRPALHQDGLFDARHARKQVNVRGRKGFRAAAENLRVFRLEVVCVKSDVGQIRNGDVLGELFGPQVVDHCNACVRTCSRRLHRKQPPLVYFWEGRPGACTGRCAWAGPWSPARLGARDQLTHKEAVWGG